MKLHVMKNPEEGFQSNTRATENDANTVLAANGNVLGQQDMGGTRFATVWPAAVMEFVLTEPACMHDAATCWARRGYFALQSSIR